MFLILGLVIINSKLKFSLDNPLSEKSQNSVFLGKFGDVEVAVKRIAKSNYFIDKKYMHPEHAYLKELYEHENIVRYYDFQEREGMIYLALELCDGDLEIYVEKEQQNSGISLDIASQICNALEYLHGKGIIHLDVKPANVLIKKLGNGKIRVKLCDMGISRKVRPGRQTYSETGDRGTVGYMPFEVLDAVDKGERASHLSFSLDIFSFAVTLHFLLSGGKHVFGKILERDTNILQKKCPDLDTDALSYEALDLLPKMMDHCASQR